MLAIVALAMTLLAPIGVQASGAGELDTQRSLMAQEAEPTADAGAEEQRVEFIDGKRHLIFTCPDGYPTTGVSLADLYADCELLHVYFCLELPPWHPMPIHPGCDDRRRL